MRVRRYRLDGRFLVQLFSHVGPLTFETIGDLPRDARLVSVNRVGVQPGKPGARIALETELVVEHPSFAEVPEGGEAPVFHLSCKLTSHDRPPISERRLVIHNPNGARCTCSSENLAANGRHDAGCPYPVGPR